MKRALQLLVAGTLVFGLCGELPRLPCWEEKSACVTAALAGFALPVADDLHAALGRLAQDQSPARQIVMVLGGTGVRMVVVLGAGLLMSPYYPAVVIAVLREVLGYLGNPNWAPAHEPTVTAWWGWILAFYLVTLALEVGILVAARAPVVASSVSAKPRT